MLPSEYFRWREYLFVRLNNRILDIWLDESNLLAATSLDRRPQRENLGEKRV
jgi:hypothetical protein